MRQRCRQHCSVAQVIEALVRDVQAVYLAKLGRQLTHRPLGIRLLLSARAGWFGCATHQQQGRSSLTKTLLQAMRFTPNRTVMPPQRGAGGCVVAELAWAGEQRMQDRQAAVGVAPQRLPVGVDWRDTGDQRAHALAEQVQKRIDTTAGQAR